MSKRFLWVCEISVIFRNFQVGATSSLTLNFVSNYNTPSLRSGSSSSTNFKLSMVGVPENSLAFIHTFAFAILMTSCPYEECFAKETVCCILFKHLLCNESEQLKYHTILSQQSRTRSCLSVQRLMA